MKMYKKKELSYKNGYIVKDGKVIGIDNEVVDLINQLEEDYQRALWNKAHPAKPAVETPEFEFVTEHGDIYPNIVPETPYLDKAVKESMEIMKDIDAISTAQNVQYYLEGIQPVINFVNDKRVVSFNQENQHRFDCKLLGNPLKLDKNTIAEFVMQMFE